MLFAGRIVGDFEDYGEDYYDDDVDTSAKRIEELASVAGVISSSSSSSSSSKKKNSAPSPSLVPSWPASDSGEWDPRGFVVDHSGFLKKPSVALRRQQNRMQHQQRGHSSKSKGKDMKGRSNQKLPPTANQQDQQAADGGGDGDDDAMVGDDDDDDDDCYEEPSKPSAYLVDFFHHEPNQPPNAPANQRTRLVNCVSVTAD